jgi:hypothetical protein
VTCDASIVDDDSAEDGFNPPLAFPLDDQLMPGSIEY